MVGLALRGKGHEVTIAYLPYGNLDKEINSFDLRRQDLYTRRVLQPLNGLIRVVSLLDVQPAEKLPESLEQVVDESAALRHHVYACRWRTSTADQSCFSLRTKRNHSALLRALSLLASELPDVVLIPNGLVTELGVVYQAARHLELNTVTYEFNDQREQIWLSQNEIVMHQDTRCSLGSAWCTASDR